MQPATRENIVSQLETRRDRLVGALAKNGADPALTDLLGLVDAALANVHGGEFGLCLVCAEPVAERDLLQNPLLEYCLCALTPNQQRALEHDLNLARRIQAGLLPDPDLAAAGWTTHFRYEPAGVVSGDYCDVWQHPDDPDTMTFAVADVSGKGVAASLLMAHTQAAFRSLSSAGMSLPDLVEHMSGQLLAANLPTHYATLVVGRAYADGRVDIVNAGHCPPLIVRPDGIDALKANGFPVGLLTGGRYDMTRFKLDRGDALLLYTDGLTEARDAAGREYSADAVARVLSGARPKNARDVVGRVRAELAGFLREVSPGDDLTLLALYRG